MSVASVQHVGHFLMLIHLFQKQRFSQPGKDVQGNYYENENVTKVLKKSVWIFSMNHMEIIVEEKSVCDRGLCLALSSMPVGSHIL